MVTNGIPCSGSGLPGDRASASSTVGGGSGGGLIVSGSCPDGISEGGSTSPGGSISVAVSASSSGNGGPSGPGGPSLLPVGLPFLPSLGPDPQFYPGHPGPGFDLKENMEAWRSIPAYAASMYGGYDGAILAGYPMLRNGYGMDLNGSRRKNATRETTSTLKAWLNDHRKNPYPTKAEKIMLAIITQMTLTQVSTWFANARRRLKKENKMTWSPRNRCDDDDDDCKEGGFNSSTDTRDVDGTPLGSVNHHRSASSLHSNGNKDNTEPDSDIDIDDDDSSSDNLIDKKRFKRNESPLSDSGGSGVTISTASGLGEHHPLHPAHLHGHPGLQHHHLHRAHPLLHPLSPQQLQHLSSLSQLNHPLAHHHLSSYNNHLNPAANNHHLLHHHHSSHHPLSLHHPSPFAPNGNTIGSVNNTNEGTNTVNSSATSGNNLVRCKDEPLSPSIPPPISLSSSPSSSTSSSPSSSTLSSATTTTTTIAVNHNRTNSNHSPSEHNDRGNIHHHHHHHHHNLNNQGIQSSTLGPSSKPRIWSIVDTAISNTNNSNNSVTTPVSTSSSSSSSTLTSTSSKSSPKPTVTTHSASTTPTSATTTTSTTCSSPDNVYHFNL